MDYASKLVKLNLVYMILLLTEKVVRLTFLQVDTLFL
ncbi:hypothetical protein Xszus_00524 [Xenorhabdus szentirmaii]|uniref:Uncharacterized protein n=1 Tax=Xenorhabdus szentirmaii DSM 16338 TaxID=1427518 RepID=W1J1S7_9GAMM|nr:hypothetical protein Xsze_03585 [Xenorhabdus szentirmaii DSM 16338]PHM40849.1 hypothetical protein Xszus_00524 [Xenorhabdus szentirmaii]CDL83831.1 conserved hypothetical protein [Xenorhabdus szentirmaii DSM 16338]